MSADLLSRLKSALADRYAVESEIGRGGMAVVFLADDLKHHRKVAIKVLHPELGAAVGGERFSDEIEIIGGLTHPHVLPLYDSGEADGLLYYVMPYVEGESLWERLDREKQLPVDEAIQIAREVADALDHAHEHGIVHRDIKPANILLEGGHAVVADFGVARAVSEAGADRVTATGMTVGTPAYMSPEQAAGKEVDERSDLYALGCIVYEMLAGEPPLTGATPQSTAAKRLTDRPTPLGAIRNTIPANLQSLVERMLATSPVDRPATARQLADELEEVRRSPGPAAGMPRRARWLVPVIGLAAIAIVVAVFSMLATDRSATREVRLLPVGADLGAQSIAVLPFANLTGADSLDWIGPGLADLLTTNLAQVEALRMVSFQRLVDLMRQVGRRETDRVPEELAMNIVTASGARAMVDGSFVRSGQDFRLDTQLIDSTDGTIIFATHANGSDVFALVDDVSERLLNRVLGKAVDPTELTSVAQLMTSSFDAYREYQEGLLAERRVQWRVADEHFQRAVELDSTFALAWLRLGMRAMDREEEQLAAGHLGRAAEYSADAPERDRLFIQAFQHRFSGEWDEYSTGLEELIARYPDEKEARFYLGGFYYYFGRPDDGWRLLDEVLQLDPYYSAAVNVLAYKARNAGDEAAADSLTLRYIELEPDISNPYDTRGDILLHFGRIEEAREMFREAIRRGGAVASTYNLLMMTYLKDGDPEGARAALEPFRNTEEGAAWTRWFEADTYVFEGRYLDAAHSVRSAAARAENLEPIHARMALGESGVHANATGAYREAEETFLELDRLDALNPYVLSGILGTYGKQERFDDMGRFRDALAADIDSVPDFARRKVEALVYFADALIAWYRDRDAEETVRLFAEGRAARGLLRATLQPSMGVQGEEVLALIEVGRASDALEIIDVMEQKADEGFYRLLAHAAWYLRGRAYEALDEPERALTSYQQLLDVAGEGVYEVVLFRDTPERVARLRGKS